MPAFCGLSKDIEKACDSVNLNLDGSMLAVRFEAFAGTPDPTNPYLLTKIEVIDPATGVFPVAGSAYAPVKIEWLYNSAQPNYEPVEGVNTPDSYIQTIGPIIVSDSETASGKANLKSLNSQMWVIVSPLKGVVNADSKFHVYGVRNGLKFTSAATAVEFGNRVNGSFRSLAGGEEATPNGVNYLDTDIAKSNTLFKQRFDPVIVP